MKKRVSREYEQGREFGLIIQYTVPQRGEAHHNKSNFWPLYPAANHDSMCHTLSPAGLVLSVMYCAIIWQLPCKNSHCAAVCLEHSSHALKAEYFATPLCNADMLLQGVLLNSSLNYNVAGAKNRNKKKKSRLDKVGCSFLFFRCLPIEQFVPPYWAGCRLPSTVCVFWCQLCFSVINLLEDKWAGSRHLLLCYADKLNSGLGHRQRR